MSRAIRTRPVLVGCSHGTRDPAGRATIHALLALVAEARPDLDVREAFVDVQEPAVATVVTDVLAERPAERPADADADAVADVVVVPLLLSGGFHVHVDIAAAVDRPGVVAATALGPDLRLVDVLQDRLDEAGTSPDDAVVIAAAGSSDARAATAVEWMVDALQARRSGPVSVGYGAGCEPRVPAAVEAARVANPGRPVVIASYLLAPGYFHDQLQLAGADVVTGPVGADPRVAAIVLTRYAEALQAVRQHSAP